VFGTRRSFFVGPLFWFVLQFFIFFCSLTFSDFFSVHTFSTNLFFSDFIFMHGSLFSLIIFQVFTILDFLQQMHTVTFKHSFIRTHVHTYCTHIDIENTFILTNAHSYNPLYIRTLTIKKRAHALLHTHTHAMTLKTRSYTQMHTVTILHTYALLQ